MPAPTPIATILTTGGDNAVLAYLEAARKHHSQAKIARHLKVDPRTIRRWEARQSVPPAYVVHALQQLLPLDPQWLADGVATSEMQAKYGPSVNRDSAYEMLTRRLEEGAAKAQAEAEAAAQAKAEAAAADKPAPRSSGASGSRSRAKSGVEKVLSSPTFWNQVMRVGGQVVRTFWGTARR